MLLKNLLLKEENKQLIDITDMPYNELKHVFGKTHEVSYSDYSLHGMQLDLFIEDKYKILKGAASRYYNGQLHSIVLNRYGTEYEIYYIPKTQIVVLQVDWGINRKPIKSDYTDNPKDFPYRVYNLKDNPPSVDDNIRKYFALNVTTNKIIQDYEPPKNFKNIAFLFYLPF